MIVEAFPDRTILVKGKDYLYFGGTAYLGLPTHPEFQKNLATSIAKWGSFYGSSRNSNIKLSVFDRAEHFFAKEIGTEDAVTVSSGTLAGRLVLDYLSKSKNTFYHYPKTHPAILHDTSKPLLINDKLHPNLTNKVKEDIVICVDAILSSEVECTSFGFLNAFPPEKRITLIVDESHSFGIVGNHGEGVFNMIPSEKLIRKIMVSSLGKALGLSGGIIAADKHFIGAMKNEILFISSSCATPAYLEAYILSQDIIKTQKQKLQENLKFLFDGLDLNASIRYHKNYPIIYCTDNNFYSNLYNNGIIITNFKYPNYPNMMNRIVVTANHTKADLEKLKNVLIAMFKQSII